MRRARRNSGDAGLRQLARTFAASGSPEDAARFLAAQARSGTFLPETFPALNQALAPAMAAVSRSWFTQGFSPYPAREITLWSDDSWTRSHRGSCASFNNGPVRYFGLALRRESIPVHPNFYGTGIPSVLGLMTPTDRGVSFGGGLRLDEDGRPEFVASAHLFGYEHPRGMARHQQRWGDSVFGLGHQNLDYHVEDRLSERRLGAYRFRSTEVRGSVEPVRQIEYGPTAELIELRLEITHPLGPASKSVRGYPQDVEPWVHQEIVSAVGAAQNPRIVRSNSDDAERRRMERAAAASGGAPDDEARVLIARMRAGELGDEGLDRITLAAVLGDAGARIAAPGWRVAQSRICGTGPMGQLPPDDPFVLGVVADSLRGHLRSWGPDVAKQVYDLSGARVEDRLQTLPPHEIDPRWRRASDRALTYMTQENFGAALEAEATAIMYLAEGLSGGDAMAAEQDRQRADMIASLLNREPPRTTIWPNPVRMNSDADHRRREREARATQAPDALARVLVERMRVGALDPQHVRWAGMLGYEPARIALPGHDLPTVGGPWTAPRLIGLVASEIAAATEIGGQPSGSPVLVGARIWSVDRSPCGRSGACAQEAAASTEARDAGDWQEAFRAARRCAALENSGDADRRRREREAAMSGAPSDETAALAASVRSGEIAEDLLQQLAAIGYEPARVVAGKNRLSISRAAVLGDPEAQAQEVLNEVGSLTRLWPLGCAAAILTASACVDATNSGAELTRRLDRLAYAAAMAAIHFMRGRLAYEEAQSLLHSLEGPLYGDVHPQSRAGQLLDAVAMFYGWLVFETSSRSAGQDPNLGRDLYVVLMGCVRACTSPTWSMQAAEAQIARAITAAVAPVLLTGRLESSPLIARLLP